MAFSTDGINVMLDRVGVVSIYVGLLGADGSTEITGGSPAYARKGVTWNAANAKSMTAIVTLLIFDVPACTVTKYILCSALTAGTTYDIIDVTDEVFAAQGSYTIMGLTLSGV